MPEPAAPPAFHDAEGRPVSGEPVFWAAYYRDGGQLRQFDPETGRFHRFADIDLERLTAFTLQGAGPGADGRPWGFVVPIVQGRRPIHFYRNGMLEVNTPRRRRVRTYGFGFQETGFERDSFGTVLTDRVVNVKSIIEVLPGGVYRFIENSADAWLCPTPDGPIVLNRMEL